MSDAPHPADRTITHPAFNQPNVHGTPRFDSSPPPNDGTVIPEKPAPAEYRNPSTGVPQSYVDKMLAEAKASGNAEYYARMVAAARADGFAVPVDAPSTVEKIVPTAPREPGFAASTSGLSQREVDAAVADLRKAGVSEDRIREALAGEGMASTQVARGDAGDDYFASQGRPADAASYRLSYGEEARTATPEAFRSFDEGFRSSMYAMGVSQELVQTVLDDFRTAAQAVAQVKDDVAASAYRTKERDILARVVGPDKVAETIAKAAEARQELKRINPALSRDLENLGAFHSARATVRMAQVADHMRYAAELRRGRK